jgi:hypothetical protein
MHFPAFIMVVVLIYFRSIIKKQGGQILSSHESNLNELSWIFPSEKQGGLL